MSIVAITFCSTASNKHSLANIALAIEAIFPPAKARTTFEKVGGILAWKGGLDGDSTMI